MEWHAECANLEVSCLVAANQEQRAVVGTHTSARPRGRTSPPRVEVLAAPHPPPPVCPLQLSLSSVFFLHSYPRDTLGEKGLRHFTCLYITYLL